MKIEKKQTSGVMVRGGTGIAANGEMVRIDVFRENGKYYFVPVYTADVVRKVLPNRAATHTKPYSEWRVMDDANFVFSLYSRDLIHVKSKKDIKTNLVMVDYCCRKKYLRITPGQILQRQVLPVLRMTVILNLEDLEFRVWKF